MRIAFCLFKYFPFGGMQKDCLRVAKECSARGHEVIIYTMSWDGELPEKLNLKLIKPKALSNHGRVKAFAKAVSTSLRQEPVDVSIGFNKIPGLDYYFAADPCYVERARRKHNFLARLVSRRHWIFSAFERSLFDKDASTKILYLSDKEKHKFLGVYNTPESRFHKVPPGIERERLHFEDQHIIRADKRFELSLTEHEKAVLFVGSGFKIKGLDRAIHAVSALPEGTLKQTVLFIAGHDNAGPYKKQVEALGLTERVVFLGARDDVPDLMLAADCLLHPARNETGGNVLLEAAASGLPVLTTESCGFAPFITNYSMGYVLPEPFEPQACSRNLNKILLTGLGFWRERSRQFVQSADVFHLPEACADLLEQAPIEG